jgi:hypothetical protein
MTPAPPSNADWATLLQTFTASLIVPSNKAHPHPALDGNAAALNKTIDHTLLKLDATEAQFEQLYAEARDYDFAVRIHPRYQQDRTNTKLTRYT